MENILCAQLLTLDCLFLTPFGDISQLWGHWCPAEKLSYLRYPINVHPTVICHVLNCSLFKLPHINTFPVTSANQIQDWLSYKEKVYKIFFVDNVTIFIILDE